MLRVETADLTKRYGPRAVVDYARTSPDPQEGKENAMFANRSWSRPWAATVAGLAVGALGIAILWASGVEFPIYPPPGIVILLTGALFVGLTPWRWAPDAGAFLGLFVGSGSYLVIATGLISRTSVIIPAM